MFFKLGNNRNTFDRIISCILVIFYAQNDSENFFIHVKENKKLTINLLVNISLCWAFLYFNTYTPDLTYLTVAEGESELKPKGTKDSCDSCYHYGLSLY